MPTKPALLSQAIWDDVEKHIKLFSPSIFDPILGPDRYVVKYLASRWASQYLNPAPLWISNTPPQTWGTATYVAPLKHYLTSGLYGRIGVVCGYDPTGWRIFDATIPAAQNAYMQWAAVQPCYSDLLVTVHSTITNHELRNQFRRDFAIDCVLFRPDQAGDQYTDLNHDTWMAVTDWASLSGGTIKINDSLRLAAARFVILIDEEFELVDNNLPVRQSKRRIQPVADQMAFLAPSTTKAIQIHTPTNPATLAEVVAAMTGNGYIHLYIQP